MTTIDEPRLESDVGYRFDYVAGFMGFGPEDVAAILGSAPLLAPLVPGLVDAVYQKLYGYTSTWRHFLPRQHGYSGDIPADMAHLTPDHPQIKFRMEHLSRYLVTLVTKQYDGRIVDYLDMVGKIHTDKAGSKQIQIPLVQMNALMGFVADAFNATILSLNLDRETEVKTLRAFSKLLWLQNDLIVKHYAVKPVAL